MLQPLPARQPQNGWLVKLRKLLPGRLIGRVAQSHEQAVARLRQAHHHRWPPLLTRWTDQILTRRGQIVSTGGTWDARRLLSARRNPKTEAPNPKQTQKSK